MHRRRSDGRAEHARELSRSRATAATRSGSNICRGSRAGTVGAYALSEAGLGLGRVRPRDARREARRRLGAQRAASCGSPTAPRPGSTWCSRTSNPSAGYKGITAFIVERGFPGFTVGKKEDKLGIRASSTTELILDGCEVPAENVLGPVGQGYKIAIETLNEGRIGIGAQMIGVARGALDAAIDVREGAHAVREAARRVPGHPVPARAGGHGARGGAAHGVQRGAPQGRRPRHSRRRPRWRSCSRRRCASA